ncbi:predicted protein [Coccidioides posadasii str. Silveira]|uniref:Predicted protein n=1 Tax=Coccidioides posadasii (strain RMSCC 757 / Silveira) TaxID=443226 RepID=E9DIR3_COCPS|nr:predicted protein [Coccidioides posadasii str. Silveira]
MAPYFSNPECDQKGITNTIQARHVQGCHPYSLGVSLKAKAVLKQKRRHLNPTGQQPCSFGLHIVICIKKQAFGSMANRHSKGRAARNEPMIDWQLQKGAVTLFGVKRAVGHDRPKVRRVQKSMYFGGHAAAILHVTI